MTPAERERFDALLGDAIASLPPAYRRVIDEIPIIVLDRPEGKLLEQLRREGTLPPEGEGVEARDKQDEGEDDDATDLMGLHTGIAITEQSVGGAGGGGLELPPTIHIFREGISAHALGDEGWNSPDADEELYEEIRITLLHELGHHFGLEEDDLDQLGYA